MHPRQDVDPQDHAAAAVYQVLAVLLIMFEQRRLRIFSPGLPVVFPFNLWKTAPANFRSCQWTIRLGSVRFSRNDCPV
jgi:hypothetical protein